MFFDTSYKDAHVRIFWINSNGLFELVCFVSDLERELNIDEHSGYGKPNAITGILGILPMVILAKLGYHMIFTVTLWQSKQ